MTAFRRQWSSCLPILFHIYFYLHFIFFEIEIRKLERKSTYFTAGVRLLRIASAHRFSPNEQSRHHYGNDDKEYQKRGKSPNFFGFPGPHLKVELFAGLKTKSSRRHSPATCVVNWRR